MMSALGELLFFRRDQVTLDDVLRHEVDSLGSKVDSLPEKMFTEMTDQQIADHVVKMHAIVPISIDLASAQPNVQETQVNVSDPFLYDRASVTVQGLVATKSIPFVGDASLWHLRTNPYDLNPPRGEIRHNRLVIGISVPAQKTDEAAHYIDTTVKSVQEYLQRQEVQIARHNASIAGNSMKFIQLRRTRLGAASDLLKKLGGS